MLPANVIVAPNSPSARAQATAVPASNAGASNRNVTRENLFVEDNPITAADSSNLGSILRSPLSTAITKNGNATNASATITPSGENVSCKPNKLYSVEPSNPFDLPYAPSSATPPTTGGSTMGSITNARTSDRPLNAMRARTQASGSPSNTTKQVAITDVTSDNRSASDAGPSTRLPNNPRHATRRISPTSGSKRKISPSAAPTKTKPGVLLATSRPLALLMVSENQNLSEFSSPVRTTRSRQRLWQANYSSNPG